jgi:hypothetical protein
MRSDIPSDKVRLFACYWRLTPILLAVLLIIVASAQSRAGVRITTIKDPSITCDYLIISPPAFISQAITLAEHRNSFSRDDVESARVVDLEQIYREFRTDDTTKVFTIIQTALLWAYKNWAGGYRYVVLIGDDSIGTTASNPHQWNRGPMPSYAFQQITVKYRYDLISTESVDSIFDTTYTYSDAFFRCPFDNASFSDSFLPITIGRIPCESMEQCSLYIKRVMQSDEHPVRGAWTNRTLLVADDALQGPWPDPIFHVETAERISLGCLQDYFVNKIYLSDFGRDASLHHVLAGDQFFLTVNQGMFWTIYFGHGHESLLADELVVSGRESFRLRNGERQGVFCSFSCSNAAFDYPFRQSMCKQFLFADSGGYLAYIGCTTLSYANDNELLAASFFPMRDSLCTTSIGELFRHAGDNACSGSGRFYVFLGDPAIRVFPNRNPIAFLENEPALSCRAAGIGPGSYYEYRIVRGDTVSMIGDPLHRYVRDTVVQAEQGALNGTSLSITSAFRGPTTRLIGYLWNDTVEANGTFDLPGENMVLLAQSKNKSLRACVINRNTLDLVGLNHSVGMICIRSIAGRELNRLPVSPGVRKVQLGNQNYPSGVYIVELLSPGGFICNRIAWIRVQ